MDAHFRSDPEPTLFTLERLVDPTGVSGTGRVLDGVVFHNGQVVVCWRSDLRQPPGPTSLAVYPSVEAFLEIHVKPHGDSSARVVLLHGDDETLSQLR